MNQMQKKTSSSMNQLQRKMSSMDGNKAAAYISYAFTEVAAIYPITPSSPMAEHIDEWSAYGKKNIFGETVRVVEMQSEGGAAGTLHGSLQAGALTSTYTASQGLLLMIPNMYKISGELLPAVFHVSARSLSTHALSIFGDHSDIYAARQTGFAMLATGSVQQVMDLAAVAHCAALDASLPFVHFFDGFRTSHEIQKVEMLEYDELEELLDREKLEHFRNRALNPEAPVTRGTAQNPDIYFQVREAANRYYDAVPDIVEEYMQKITALTSREYHPFAYYGDPEAEQVIVAMGSATETIKETVDYLNAHGGKAGLVTVHLYRPFSEKYFFRAMPRSVKKIAVLDRTKEPGSTGEPLYLDVMSMFYGKPNQPLIAGGRYGLSSKDVTPDQVKSVFDNLMSASPKNGFTIGITDDVTGKSLPVVEKIRTVPQGTFAAKFDGLGSDGTVGANKNSIKIIGDNTDLYAQAYFAYDSKKSGGVTVSHLRFGSRPITSTYLVTTPDFVACHVPAYLEKYDILNGLKEGGGFLLNSPWDEEETKKRLPNGIKKYLAEKNIRFYIIDASHIAEEIGMAGRTNSIMQSAFFKAAGVISYDLAVDHMKKAVKNTYGKKGDDVVERNYSAITRGGDMVKEVSVPAGWKDLPPDGTHAGGDKPEFIKKIVEPMNNLRGDNLPVSAFLDCADGTFPQGTAAYEKRGIAIHVPRWIPENCIQCNQCAYVCPHAVIRPFLLDSNEMAALPFAMDTLEANGKELAGLRFRIQISPLDCTGCGNCVDVCPAKTKALEMKTLESELDQSKSWDHLVSAVKTKDSLVSRFTVKGSQFVKPLLEFHGACGGCGETPHYRLITQLFGERMMIANATGCSSIYSGSAPSTPFTTSERGRGPAWASSLFEDNAEYGLGMYLGYSQMRNRVGDIFSGLLREGLSEELGRALKLWLENRENAEVSDSATEKIIPLLEKENSPLATEALKLRQYMRKRSVWIVGGDGWAYDIGYGGLDHVLASGNDVNVLVLDTEVYSNTGGQSSKSTPTAAVAKFAASGKKLSKKDLGLIAMTYGYIYVAQVAMGASQSQFIKTLKEAEEYPGPSLIIAYSPCINHGLRSGMGKTQAVMKSAVESGYWQLFRYNPLLKKEGKNPFTLDSREPDWSRFTSFLMNETRFTSLKHEFPDQAEELYATAEENARKRYSTYKKMADEN